MHPVLANARRLGLYLLGWSPILVLLIALVAATGNLGWGEATAFILPLFFTYAFICLSPWYACRRLPLDKTPLTTVLLTQFTAALINAAALTGLAWGLASALASALPGFDTRAARQLPLIFAAALFLYLVAAAFHYVLVAFENSREAEKQAMEARLLAGDAELRALKAQVNPHFLFNSLHSISALTSADPAGAREMCIRLSDFLRRTLGLADKQTVPLAEELALVRAYLAVEQVRFGARLEVSEEIEPDCPRLLVPPLLLQPLVENAVVHGIANLPEGGRIRIEAHCEDRVLRILVENSMDPDSPPRRRTGIGLVNVRRRLDTRYGNHAGFSARSAGNTYRAAIALPAESEVTTA